MKLRFVIFISFSFLKSTLSNGGEEQDFQQNEEKTFLIDSIKKYGSPRPLNYENCNLPGPEVVLEDADTSNEMYMFYQGAGNYTLKVRAITKTFSYNDHYEVGKITIIGDEKMSTIRGQFTEKIPKLNGGFFLRTVGYIHDEKGYRHFLIDVTKITPELKLKPRKFYGGYRNTCGVRRKRSPLPPGSITCLVGGGLG